MSVSCKSRARMSDTPVPKRHPWKATWVFMESQKEAGMERHILNWGEKPTGPITFDPTVQRDMHLSDTLRWILWTTEASNTWKVMPRAFYGETFPKNLQTLGHGMSFMWMSKKLWVSNKISKKTFLLISSLRFFFKGFPQKMEEFGLFGLEFPWNSLFLSLKIDAWKTTDYFAFVKLRGSISPSPLYMFVLITASVGKVLFRSSGICAAGGSRPLTWRAQGGFFNDIGGTPLQPKFPIPSMYFHVLPTFSWDIYGKWR